MWRMGHSNLQSGFQSEMASRFAEQWARMRGRRLTTTFAIGRLIGAGGDNRSMTACLWWREDDRYLLPAGFARARPPAVDAEVFRLAPALVRASRFSAMVCAAARTRATATPGRYDAQDRAGPPRRDRSGHSIAGGSWRSMPPVLESARAQCVARGKRA